MRSASSLFLPACRALCTGFIASLVSAPAVRCKILALLKWPQHVKKTPLSLSLSNRSHCATFLLRAMERQGHGFTCCKWLEAKSHDFHKSKSCWSFAQQGRNQHWGQCEFWSQPSCSCFKDECCVNHTFVSFLSDADKNAHPRSCIVHDSNLLWGH